jgi:hypothetical protein
MKFLTACGFIHIIVLARPSDIEERRMGGATPRRYAGRDEVLQGWA